MTVRKSTVLSRTWFAECEPCNLKVRAGTLAKAEKVAKDHNASHNGGK